MKYNLPAIIRNHHVPAKGRPISSKWGRNSNCNWYKLCLWILIAMVLISSVILISYRTITYDNPSYTNVSRVLPSHNWKVKFDTSSLLLNQRINFIANQQSWHFAQHGDVTINDQPQSAYDYETTRHDLKLKNANSLNDNDYMKFKLVKISHNKRYTFKRIKSNAIPHEDQRSMRLILTRNNNNN